MKFKGRRAVSSVGGVIVLAIVVAIGLAAYFATRPVVTPAACINEYGPPGQNTCTTIKALTTTSTTSCEYVAANGCPTSTITSTSTVSTGAMSVTILRGSGQLLATSTYSPGTITIHPGDTVTWTNQDSVVHTVVANDRSFSSTDIAPGGSFTWTFQIAGTYTYHCTYHSWMQGTVVVKQ